MTATCSRHLQIAAAAVVRSGCTQSSRSLCSGGRSFTHTIRLPKTGFKQRLSGKALSARDGALLSSARQHDFYNRQLNSNSGEKFTLLDGPPYANGPAHLGHALNKLLKDFVVRYNVLTGKRVVHRAGWDFHGLPIELKVLQDGDASGREQSEIRQRARKFAGKCLDGQRKSFEKWALLSNLQNPYVTDDNTFQSSQLNVVARMLDLGLLYRANKPVYWSPTSETALAEAELEYNEKHKSDSVYYKFDTIGFPLEEIIVKGSESSHAWRNANVWLVVWTTTPWTLPLNDAVCFSDKMEYVLLGKRRAKPSQNLPSDGQLYIISSADIHRVQSQVDFLADFEVYARLPDPTSIFSRVKYCNPFKRHLALPIVPGEHVGQGKGTGLVHTAFAHGFDDFKIAETHQFPVSCFVDDAGRYTREMVPNLAGLDVMSDGSDAALSEYKKHVLHRGHIQHSYPYDWRTKQPVIIKTSPQWFVDLEKLRVIVEKQLESVNFVNKADQISLVTAMLKNRPDWCISRQRSWGVPLPFMYSKSLPLDGTAVNFDVPVFAKNGDFARHLSGIVEKHGTDVWWKMNAKDLVTPELLLSEGIGGDSELVKGTDIMDVWFDSGCAWQTLENPSEPADLVIEGRDQFRGWFQSLQWTKAAVNYALERESNGSIKPPPPYKRILSHGFVVDEQARKMSKSLGNVVSADQVIRGARNIPAVGVDGLRMWAASFGSGKDTVRIGKEIVTSIKQRLRSIRNTLRFALGALADFDLHSVDNLDVSEMCQRSAVDAYVLHEAALFLGRVQAAYDRLDFAYSLSETEKFLNGEIGSFYISTVKDRLYCDAAKGPSRVAAQTTLYLSCSLLVQLLAPILPHLADEFYLNLHGFPELHCDDARVYSIERQWPKFDHFLTDAYSSRADQVGLARNLFKTVNESFGAESPASRCVFLASCHQNGSNLRELDSLNRTVDGSSGSTELAHIWKCAKVVILQNPEDLPSPKHYDEKTGVTVSSENVASTLARCPRCRLFSAEVAKVNSEHNSELCGRCADVLKMDHGWSSDDFKVHLKGKDAVAA